MADLSSSLVPTTDLPDPVSTATLPSATETRLQKRLLQSICGTFTLSECKTTIAALEVRKKEWLIISCRNYFISDWISNQGPLEVFSIIGGVHIFILLLTIPMWIFGKRCRSLTARNPFFRKIQES